MATRFQVGLREADGDRVESRKLRKRRARKRVHGLVFDRTAPYEVWREGSKAQRVTRRDPKAATDLAWRFLDASKTGERVYVRALDDAGERDLVWVQKVIVKIIPTLPSSWKSDGWQRSDKKLWRSVMWRPGVIYQGSFVCRAARGTSTPSQHAYRNPIQAHDFGWPTLRAGDRFIARWRKRHGARWFVCWENCTNHRSWKHSHFEKKPKRTGLPRCMGGSA